MGEYLIDVLAGGSVATYQKSGTAVALHIWDLSPSAAGRGYAGSDAYQFVKSGTTWIAEPEYREIVISGTPDFIGSVAIVNIG